MGGKLLVNSYCPAKKLAFLDRMAIKHCVKIVLVVSHIPYYALVYMHGAVTLDGDYDDDGDGRR